MPASMGPQPFGCGRIHPQQERLRQVKLQWGRNLSVAEGTLFDAPSQCGNQASMGPQPFGCGRPRAMARRNSRLASFNGAATFRLRKVYAASSRITACAVLQWGRNLSVAEGARTCHSNGPRPGFNGAATFRLRKGRLPDHRSRAHGDASMGPQPFGCGRLRPGVLGRLARSASMGPQPFGCGRDHHAGGRAAQVLRFNGAATFRLRKAGGPE